MKGKLKKPMLIAAAIAVACMFIDDLPQPDYGTFRDPGAAAMLSIIFANAITTPFSGENVGYWPSWRFCPHFFSRQFFNRFSA